MTAAGFVPPAYPYDRLSGAAELAAAHEGGVVDLSVGTPTDPPPPEVVGALAASGAERGYPASIGSLAMREAAAGWLGRRFAVELPAAAVAACVGTKEFVATTPQWLSLRDPSRDTVLYPEISYPTYEMGAVLARLRAVAVPARADGTMDLDSVAPADAARALMLWVNSPANPTGALDDLGAAAAWGRRHGVPVFSDECYAEFTWDGPPRSILQHGPEGVVAVHSLSKRSNLAGVRAGFYAGDQELVGYLSEVRKHAGFMVPGPVQAASVVALGDQDHVDAQRGRYLRRLQRLAEVLAAAGLSAELPRGGFYLWVAAPVPEGGGDPAWVLTEHLARRAGALVSPGEFYGPAGAGFVRLAVVAQDDRIELVARRLGVA